MLMCTFSVENGKIICIIFVPAWKSPVQFSNFPIWIMDVDGVNRQMSTSACFG